MGIGHESMSLGKTGDAIEITTAYSRGISQKTIRELLVNQKGRIIVDYPLSYIGVTQSPLDIMHNYLEASYVAETLGPLAINITQTEVSGDSYWPISRLEITTDNADTLAEKIFDLSIVLSEEQEDDVILANHWGDLQEYAENLQDRIFFCPDLVDSYYANLINGAYSEIESESEETFLQTEFAQYPERKYGFWKSARSSKLGFPIYVSTDGWVAQKPIDLQVLLLGIDEQLLTETYEEADIFSTDGYSYLVSAHNIVYFPFGPCLKAQKCITALIENDDALVEKLERDVLTYFPIDDDLRENYGFDRSTLRKTSYRLATSGYSLVVETDDSLCIFFPHMVKADKLADVYERISQILSRVGEFCGMTSSISIPWDSFDDEKFETLCYDIVMTPKTWTE